MSISLTLMTAKRLAQWLSSWHHPRTVGRALPPRRFGRRKISASAAAGRTVGFSAGRTRTRDEGRRRGRRRRRRRRRKRGRSFDVRPSVRPSAHRRSPSSAVLTQSSAARPSLPSLIAPVIRSRIPERASERGTFWPLSSALSD